MSCPRAARQAWPPGAPAGTDRDVAPVGAAAHRARRPGPLRASRSGQGPGRVARSGPARWAGRAPARMARQGRARRRDDPGGVARGKS